MQVIKEDGLISGVTIYRKLPAAKPENNIVPIKRVAAYCRVSTEIEKQKSSLSLQMSAYEQIINEHPGWTLAGIYADKGISGTKTKNRPEFNRMIDDARNGKIDVILAKSLSRFARNTVDTLSYTRELKSIGVTVYFEKEHIDTASDSSEFLLTIFAAFAQEESHSISENTKRGIRNKFKLGQPRYSKILGYDNNWNITEESHIITKIFNLAFDGKSKREIADILNNENSSISGKDNKRIWNHNTILSILRNEKYTGDVLMQKSYIGDYLLHNKIYNKNLTIDSYYKENHHEAIIDKELFHALNFETNLKRGKYGADQTPYYGKLKCPYCGKNMVRIPGIYTEKRPMWVCPGKDLNATLEERRTCPKLIIFSSEIDKVINTAIEGMETQPGFVESIVKLKSVITQYGKPSYCRLYPLIQNMTIENDATLVINWKMGWIGKYNINPARNSQKLWPAIAKAHIENIVIDKKELHKVNHPYRK